MLQGQMQQNIEDSELMRATLAAARFMVELKEADLGTIPNEVILKKHQELVDTDVIALFAATVTFTIELIKNGHLKRPAHYPQAGKSKLIIPVNSREQ